MGCYITLGFEVDGEGQETRIPVRVTRDQLGGGHGWIRGRTRSGKSSLSFLSLILQLIEPYEDSAGNSTFDPIVVIDLGGDPALFHSTRAASIASGRRFRFVTLDRDQEIAWDYFDPFEFFGSQGPMRQASALIEALNLDPGLDSDKAYFAGQNLMAVKTALRDIASDGRHPTLEDLASQLNMRAFPDAQQVWMALQFLSEYPQLSPPQGTDFDRIASFRRALEDGEVIYLFAPTMNEATTARAFAGLGMRNAVEAAVERTNRGLHPKRLWIFADEYQEIAGNGFAATLAQSGKHGISILMANQTTDQLLGRDSKLASVVRDNTHLKIYFSIVGDADIREVQSYSGEDIDVIEGGWSAGHHGTTISAHASKDFELSRDDILDTSATFGHAFLIFDDGRGYRVPRRIWMSHRISAEVYQALKRRPLPRRIKRTALSLPPTSEPTPSPARAPTNSDAAFLPLARLIERKREAESFDNPSIH